MSMQFNLTKYYDVPIHFQKCSESLSYTTCLTPLFFVFGSYHFQTIVGTYPNNGRVSRELCV